MSSHVSELVGVLRREKSMFLGHGYQPLSKMGKLSCEVVDVFDD